MIGVKVIMLFKNFSKKENKKQKNINYPYSLLNTQQKTIEFCEPWTIAKARLENKCKDYGFNNSIKLYNEHKIKLQNQWQNPFQSINAGYGTANLSFYNYQVVDYIECGFLAQDPLMNNIFNILSSIPLSKGGTIQSEDTELVDLLNEKIKEYKIYQLLEQALKTTLIFGGCLIFKDYGLTDLDKPLKNDKNAKLKGFIIIEPINLTALNTNTSEVARSDYMEPEMYNVVGLGAVHKSHFIKLEYNEPPKFLKPLCLYFGMPLTQLIKQDVANTNLISQGIANLVNKIRRAYLKMDITAFATENAKTIMDRMNLMQQFDNNFSIFPIGLDEEVQQLVMSLQGIPECLETSYECLSSKTGIPVNKLNGKSTGGLNASTSQIESDKNFIDKTNSIRELVLKPALLQILACFTDEKLDYEFCNLANETEQEKASSINTNLDIGLKMQELGYSQEDIDKWLKSNKINNMQQMNTPDQEIKDDKFIEEVI